MIDDWLVGSGKHNWWCGVGERRNKVFDRIVSKWDPIGSPAKACGSQSGEGSTGGRDLDSGEGGVMKPSDRRGPSIGRSSPSQEFSEWTHLDG